MVILEIINKAIIISKINKKWVSYIPDFIIINFFKRNIYIIKLKSDDIVPMELDLDDTENLYTRWIDIKDAGKLTLDMKTIFSLHIYANLIK